MAKPIIKSNPRVAEIFNEADLYNFRSYAFQQFNKHAQNKSVKNMWDEDARRFAGRF